MSSKDPRVRELEAEYRRKRQAILDSKTSWERKMIEIKVLHDHYRQRLEAVRDERSVKPHSARTTR